MELTPKDRRSLPRFEYTPKDYFLSVLIRMQNTGWNKHTMQDLLNLYDKWLVSYRRMYKTPNLPFTETMIHVITWICGYNDDDIFDLLTDRIVLPFNNVKGVNSIQTERLKHLLFKYEIISIRKEIELIRQDISLYLFFRGLTPIEQE